MNKEGHIMKALIVDDELSIRTTLSGVLNDEGWETETAPGGREGLYKLGTSYPDLVFLDVWMNGMDGITTLQKMREINPQIPIVIMSGHGNIETAVKATKLGAFEFLEKPLSLEKLLPLLVHAEQIRETSKVVDADQDIVIIGNCPSILQITKQVDIVASKNAWVLITGENGTGKEVVARRLHRRSSRSKKKFVAVNCAAIPEELIESELFGHTKGAFTNALQAKRGKFEMADGGTLFLDEIGDMSLRTQAKILRILQEQCFEKVGGTESIHVDVRVVAATNKDLKREIEQGRFREDLFYRLNVIPFHLPPLRERGSDTLLLADFFLCRIACGLEEKPKILSEDAKAVLLSYSWPGNVRELNNFLERAVIMSPDGELTADYFRRELLGNVRESGVKLGFAENITLKQAKVDFERSFILDKLEENQWNISKTSESIGVERSNLHRKIKALEIDTKKLKG